jgi:5-oxopent-3-ene-1,2,5-tricarboxylate decarboxylase/2-hydroxyhepta-2,4-diene-1,7-dioate isomerase
VAGYTIVNDISVPHASFYRPSMRFKCRDSFCPIGPVVVPPQSVANPDALNITVAVDGVVLQRCTTAGLIRPIAQLMADITEFMTLHPGDVLTVGVAAGSLRARVGQRVSITIDGIGQLVNTLIPEEQS